MQKIDKDIEPIELTKWKKQHSNRRYDDLDSTVRVAIRKSLLNEQRHLCAYCCQAIDQIEKCHNEHVLPQATHNATTLEYRYLVASCNIKKQCGDAHAAQALPLTPLMDECETELEFKWSGRVAGKSARAKEAIRVLNLGDSEDSNKALVAKRKRLCDALLLRNYGGTVEDLELEDEDVIRLVVEEISRPVDGKLESFAPIFLNLLRQR